MSALKLTLIFVVAVGAAAESFPAGQQTDGKTLQQTAGFTVGKQYNLNGQLNKDGQASASLYGLVGFNGGPGPSYYTGTTADTSAANVNSGPYFYNAEPNMALYGGTSSLWSGSAVNYYAAGAVIVGVLLAYAVWLIFFNFGGAAALRDLEEDILPAKKDDKVPTSKKSRRRRAIQKDAEAARLASIVLSAIESGECLEQSICLIGSQLSGTARGRLCSGLLEKLVPRSVQGNAYFLTLRKALKGEASCDKFKCSH